MVFIITSHQPKNLKKHTSNSSLIPHRPYASVRVKYQSNKWSLFNPTHESKTRISNDMQCSNKLNTPMTCNPQLWCESCPINNITTNKKNIYIYIDKNKYIQTKAIKTTNKTNKQTDKMFVHTPKLKWHIVPNVARNTIQWDEEPKCAKPKTSPKLEHQDTYQKLTAIFSHKHKHQKVNCY